MKITLFTAGALVVALAMPLAASAQQGPPPGQGYGQPGASGARNRATPSEAKIQHRWMKRMRGLNLSGDQQQHIQSLIDQYSQAHPAGSPRDRGASQALRQQILGTLSSDQQSQYRQMMQQRRAQMQARRAQMNGGQGQPNDQQGQNPQMQYGDPRYQQGPPGPQQGPPDQGGPPPYQGGPQDQGGPPPYQGGPQDQGGPPPDQGQPPA